MDFKKYRWSKDYEAAEEELELLLYRISKEAVRHELAAYERQELCSIPTLRRIWCAEGSMQYIINGKHVSLQPGDALDVQPNVPHEASAGVAGCVWYETIEQKL